MKILVYVGLFEGSGVGNVKRMKTLCSYILSQKEEFNIIFTGKDIDRIKALCQNLFNYISFNDLKKIQIDFDFIFLDTTERPAREVTAHLKKFSPIIIGFDYFDYLDKNVTHLINLYSHFKEQAINFSGTLFEGEKYAILTEGLIETKRKRVNRKNDSILISFGGEDPQDNSFLSVSVFKDIGVESIDCVLGPLYKGKLRNETINGVNILPFSNDFSSLLCEYDIITCGGGTTVLEAIFLEMSIVAKPQNEFEERFLSNLEIKTNTIVNLDDLHYIEQLHFDQNNTIVDGKGKSRILEIVSSI